MPQAKKAKMKAEKVDLRERIMTEVLRREKEEQAEYRRQLLATLEPKVAEYARREFAKLGLF